MTKKIKNIKIAGSYFEKMIGVIGWKDWKGRRGLLLKDANSIHTFFVRFPIDVVFLSSDFEIMRIAENIRPFQIGPVHWKAKHTLELPAGAAKKLSLQSGMKIDLIKP